MSFNPEAWASKKIVEKGQIKDPAKAETVAYAEKPYRDAARLDGITPEMKSSLDRLAVTQGDKTQHHLEYQEMESILSSLDVELEKAADISSLELVTRKFYDIGREEGSQAHYYRSKVEQKVSEMLMSADPASLTFDELMRRSALRWMAIQIAGGRRRAEPTPSEITIQGKKYQQEIDRRVKQMAAKGIAEEGNIYKADAAKYVGWETIRTSDGKDYRIKPGPEADAIINSGKIWE